MTLHTVFGASGLIGSRLVKFLRQAGENVLALERQTAPNWEADLGHVYYCIGLTADFRQRPHDTVRAHVGVLNDTLEKARCESFLYLSSTRVYQHTTDTRETAALAVNPSCPGDLYNLSKLMGESVCLAMARPSVRIARLSNVIAPHPVAPNAHTFFDAVLNSIEQEQRVVLKTHLNSAKDYIGLDDVVALLVRIATGGKERLYNVAQGENLRSALLLEAIRQHLPYNFSVETAPDARIETFPVINTQRIAAEFQFTPSAIASTIQKRLAHAIGESKDSK